MEKSKERLETDKFIYAFTGMTTEEYADKILREYNENLDKERVSETLPNNRV